MKMIKTLVCLCLFVSSFAFGQQDPWDSLDPRLEQYKIQDSTRIKLLVDATWYYNVRKYNDGLPLILEALAISEKIKSKNGKARAYVAYANYFFEKGEYQEVTDYLLEAIPILEETQDIFYLREAKIIMAKVERENDNFQKGIDMCLTMLADMETEMPSIQKACIHLTAGHIYVNLKGEKFEEALVHLEEGKRIFESLNSTTGVAIANNKIARFYKVKIIRSKDPGSYDNAITYAQKARTTFEELNQQNNLGYVYYTLGSTNSIVGKHKESVPFYEKSLVYNNEIENLPFSMRINQHLFIAHSILKDQEKAIRANADFATLKDSIFNIEKRKLLTDAQTKFETAKISAEKEKAEATSIRNRNYLIGSSIIGGLILLASLFFFGRMRERKKAELITMELRETQKRLALEKQYRESELKALKSQMNPHFIFNALNSIQEYIVMNKKNEASDYLGKFADLIRTYLNHSDTGVISLQEEIESLDMYLDLESLRFEDKLHYELKVSEKLNKDIIHIPTMLIQPYVENALKHGLLHKKDNRNLIVSFLPSETNNVKCVIEDNGVGRAKAKEFQAKKNKLHKSFAAKATEERLDLLNYGKDKKIGVEIIDLFDEASNAIGTKVVLQIPIKRG